MKRWLSPILLSTNLATAKVQAEGSFVNLNIGELTLQKAKGETRLITVGVSFFFVFVPCPPFFSSHDICGWPCVPSPSPPPAVVQLAGSWPTSLIDSSRAAVLFDHHPPEWIVGDKTEIPMKMFPNKETKRLLLSDEDHTTKSEGDCKRLNTLSHYKVGGRTSDPRCSCFSLVLFLFL